MSSDSMAPESIQLRPGEGAEEKVKIECPNCYVSVKVPSTYFGMVRCPTCGQEFPFIPQPAKEGEEFVERYLGIKTHEDYRFWIGFVVPATPPTVIFILLSTGVLTGSSSPDLSGLFVFMCSLCLWPVIGFSLAYSSGTFIKNFRDGARTSAIISLTVVILLWTLLFSFVSGGVTN